MGNCLVSCFFIGARYIPARFGSGAVGRPSESEVHVSSQRIVVRVLVQLFRQKFRRKRDQKRLKTQSDGHFSLISVKINALLTPSA